MIKPFHRFIFCFFLVAALCVALPPSGWAQDESDGESLAVIDEPSDPFEPINRVIFFVNNTLDGLIVRPMTRIYRGVVPLYGRQRVTDFFRNMGEPVTGVNDVLQGEFGRAGDAFARFFINVFVGFGGFYDVASQLQLGLDHHSEDLGQTLAVYGIDAGPYLVIPLSGPTTLRDFAASYGQGYISPLGYLIPSNAYADNTRSALGILDSRARNLDEFEAMEETSLDLYSTIRSLYFQNRNYEIRNGQPAAPSELFDDLELEE